MKHLILLLALALPAAAQTLTNTNLDGVTNATINGKLDDDAVATRTALGLGTAATADTSVNGGANKVLQYDANGDLRFSGSAPAGTAATIGGVFFQDLERVWWLNENRTDGGSIFYYTDHDINGGELQISSPNRMALCLGSNGALQLGLASGTSNDNFQFAYMQQRGLATALYPEVDSLPLYFQPAYHNGTLNVQSFAGSIQAVALDQAGNSSLDFSIRAVQPSGAGTDGSRPLDMQITPAGVWEAGKAPSWDILTDASTVTQTCSIYKSVQSAKLTLSSASRTLAISGAAAGMRGVIYVKQSGGGSYLLTLPTNSAKVSSFALSTIPGMTDRLQWEFDGSYYFWTIANAIEVPLDADVVTFADAGRANITDATQKDALNNLVSSLKASNVAATGTLWSKFSVIYPFVGGNATAHSRNLKSTSYDITWVNTATHNASGVTGIIANSAYGDTNFNMALLGQDSASLYVYNKTASPSTAGQYLLAAQNGGTSRTSISMNTGSGEFYTEINQTAVASVGAGGSYAKHFAINRSGAATVENYVNATRTNKTNASVAPWSGDLFLLARNISGAPGGYTEANIAFTAFGSSLTEAEWTAFRAIIDTFQTALGRANP